MTEEKIIIYYADLYRGKFEYPEKDVNSLKELLYDGYCQRCLKYFDIKDLKLDHEIPVRVCGNIIDWRNLNLLCNSCHKKKTKIDILIISILKKLDYFDTRNFYKNPDRIIELFTLLKEDYENNNYKKKKWLNGEKGIDYLEEKYKKNREIDNNGLLVKEYKYEELNKK
ncbi:MAG: HNH endonuclease signature motif containing protein [Candidatus Woesearchaeota archaeon]|jgi:hypothetical protein